MTSTKPQNETPKDTPAETPPAEQPKPVERTVDPRAIYTPGSGNAASTATSQGEVGGQGNQGVVVVEISVDKDGKVIKTRPGVKGSTTANKVLLDAAEKAARQTKFTPKPNVIEQTGTLTYIFKLQMVT